MQSSSGRPKKVLVVLSSAKDIELHNGKRVETGFFLSELMVPVMKLKDAGYQVVYANPTGTTPAVDSRSDLFLWFGINYGDYKRAKRNLLRETTQFQAPSGSLRIPRTFASITDEELQSFAGVFLPGGHAPMSDLWQDSNLGRLLMHFHMSLKPTAAICHGPVGLLSTRLVNNDHFAYAGYNGTCYSNNEEMMNEALWMGKMKFRLEDALVDHGMCLHNRLPMLPNLVTDRELITGQGPTSAWRLGDAFLEALEHGVSEATQAQKPLYAETYSSAGSTTTSLGRSSGLQMQKDSPRLLQKPQPVHETQFPVGEVGQRMTQGVSTSMEHTREHTTTNIRAPPPAAETQ